MKIHLEELQHQRDALDAILAAFPAVDRYTAVDAKGLVNSSAIANPLLTRAYQENKFIDVKMETGTGKTYTYTRMMYELHERLGLFKFIVVVPSVAIKEGAKAFLTADYARQHFKKFFPQADLVFNTISSGDFSTKRGRKEIPNAIREFVEADTNNKNQIHVLLLSDKGYLDKVNSSMFKDDYDSNLFGDSSIPIEMLAKTRSVVIIDEPHRMARSNNTYANIVNRLRPEMIVRLGATFPTITEGKGKNEITKTDYFRGDEPQFNLTAIDAFNQDLVKGVAIYIPENVSRSDSYRVKAVNTKKLILERNGQEFELKIGDNLADIDNRFENNLTFEGGKLSNDLELSIGMNLLADIFTNSYQEVLLTQALNAHFEAERENFLREGYRLKTNALFFIDNIASYREENGWLKKTFEKLLKQKLESLIENETDNDYKAFLQATLADIPAAHGGYFAEDSKVKGADDKISEEIDVILRNKNKSLAFNDEQGNWNTLRFFFSKWTLREGWDNPNVFTIAKLRSSGSESSKIQEVGRGLRLPVDEAGNRLSDELWYLNFVVDESERDFAAQLQGEINSEAVEAILENEEISSTIIEKLKKSGFGANKREITNKLYDMNVIDDDEKVIDVAKLRSLLPKVRPGKIKKAKPNQTIKTVKLKKENWDKIKDFWKKMSARYMIEFERGGVESQLPELFEEILNDKGIFDNNRELSVAIYRTQHGAEAITVAENSTSVDNDADLRLLNYNAFIRQISEQTNLPVTLVHKAMVNRLKDKNSETIKKIINDMTCSKIILTWQEKFRELFAQKYKYNALDFRAKTSVMKGDDFVNEIAEGTIGRIPVNTEVDDRNLFEKILVDSEIPEADIARIIPDKEIKVFGKIPQRAIQVPTYTGGTTTPDFVFAANNGLYILVEAKSNDLRDTEVVSVNAQKDFFGINKKIIWKKVTSKSEVEKLLKEVQDKQGGTIYPVEK